MSDHDAATVPPAGDSRAEQAVGERYELRERLGEGGMGVVWAAHDRALDRTVALKVLHDRFLGAADQERLADEARAMARLTHRNVVAVYDVGEREGRTFLTMELVRGQPVSRWLKTPRRWREVVDVFRAAGEGLAAAHAAGIVHRDVKPSNILVGDDGEVRVADFGVASASAPIESAALTTTASFAGTPAYMPPERLRGAPADARGDLFSFCAALYEALHGRLPFEGKTVDELAIAIDRGPPPPARTTPRWLDAVVARGLDPDPSKRFASMRDLLLALRGPRRRAAWIAGAALVVAGSAAFALTRGGGGDQPDCGGVARELDGIWDHAARARVDAGFARLGRAYAVTAWARVAPHVDAYAGEWRLARRTVCEAAGRRDDTTAMLDRQRACLDERRTELGRVVAALASPDATTADHVERVITGLPPIADCKDFGYLAAVSTGGGGAIDRARAALADARAAIIVGREQAGLSAADTAVDAARRAGDRALEAEATAARARLLASLGRLGDAADAFRSSAEIAVAIGATPQRIDAWLGLGEMLQRMGRLDDAAATIDLASAAVATIADPPRRAKVLEQQGILAGRRGDYETARRRFTEAIATGAEAHLDGTLWSAALHANLAIALRHLDRNADALAEIQRAMELDRQLGDDHPSVGHSLITESQVLDSLGRSDEARAEATRALDVLRRARGDDSLDAATAHGELGRLASEAHDEATAAREYAVVVAIDEKLAPESDATAEHRSNLADALRALGRLDEAEPLLRAVLASRIAKRGELHPDVAAVRRRLGQLLADRGRFDDAMTELERARADVEHVNGPQHTSVAEVYRAEAAVLHHAHRDGAAVAAARKALSIYAAVLPEGHTTRAAAMVDLADDLLAAGDAGEALPLAEQAAKQLHAGGDAYDASIADFAAAAAAWQVGRDRPGAIARARSARAVIAMFAPADPEGPLLLARVDAWLAAHAPK